MKKGDRNGKQEMGNGKMEMGDRNGKEKREPRPDRNGRGRRNTNETT